VEFGRNKKEQALRLGQSIVEAAKTKVRSARDALVKRVNEARRKVGEKIDQIREARERARKEAEIRRLEEKLGRMDEQIKQLLAEKAVIEARLAQLKQLEQPTPPAA
jgi:uncharacterized protein YhaN